MTEGLDGVFQIFYIDWHQIKAQQFFNNFLLLNSPLSQSRISEVEF